MLKSLTKGEYYDAVWRWNGKYLILLLFEWLHNYLSTHLSTLLCQQIKPSDVWRENQYEDMHWLDRYHLKMTLCYPFSGSTIEFEGTTNDSQQKVKFTHGMSSLTCGQILHTL